VTQRKQHVEAEQLSAALLREAEGRRAAEDVGLRSEQRYRAIIDSTRSLIALLDPGRGADRRQPGGAGKNRPQPRAGDRQAVLGNALVDA
jgi:PAS domain-containing protein